MQTGFAFIDGDERSPAATPRHWLVCLGFGIISVWLLQTVQTAFAYALAFASMSEAMLGLPTYAQPAPILSVMGWLLVGPVILLTVVIVLSWRVDGRGPRALGLHEHAANESIPWLGIGLLAAMPALWTLNTQGPDWSEAVAASVVLVPITAVQSGAEEVFWRGIVLTSLAARYGAARGVLISAVLFGLWHCYAGQPLADALVHGGNAFVFGLTSGLLVLHQGHLGGAIALHVVWNVVSFIAAGREDASVDFWTSIAEQSLIPLTWVDLRDPAIIGTSILPLVIETALVLIICRKTLARLFKPR